MTLPTIIIACRSAIKTVPPSIREAGMAMGASPIQVVFHLGLSDLALSTEARYTRHPATSDSVVVSMDHPGAIDHFPSTFFWAPVR